MQKIYNFQPDIYKTFLAALRYGATQARKA